MTNPFLSVHPEVEAALAEGRPVVALESTIIAHGMPYPQNVETAFRLEGAVREAGAVPATIAVIGGRLKAGLDAAEIEKFGAGGKTVRKISRRDLPIVAGLGLDGATTVASTMIIAGMAGIRFFGTGGIGGVHRGAAQTMDISADLQELAHTDVAVVTAGAKSILDLPLTLEYLETLGVPVIGYGTTEFPAFYTRDSGLPVDYRAETPEEIARILHAKWGMGLSGGAVIANPIPESHAIPRREIEPLIEQAVMEAEQQNIRGKALTPFLLARMETLAQGRSLISNIELALNNVRLAAWIAVVWEELRNRRIEELRN